MKYFLIIPGLIGLVIFVVTLVRVFNRRNTSSSGSGNQNPHTPPAAHAAGGHGHHHNAEAIESLQALSGGLIIWQDWGLKSCFTALFMLVLCLMALTSGFHSVALKIWWGLASLMFLIFTVTQVIRVFKSKKDAAGHIHQHYWDKYTESLIATAMWLGFIVVICTGPTSFVYELNRKEGVKVERRAEMKVAKTKATAWMWKHTSQWVQNSQTEVLVWEEGPSGKVVFKSPLTTGKVVTVSYSAGSETGVYLDTKDPSYQGVIKPLGGNLKSGIPPFEGKSQVVGFGLFEGEAFEGTITFTPLELKWEHRKGTD